MKKEKKNNKNNFKKITINNKYIVLLFILIILLILFILFKKINVIENFYEKNVKFDIIITASYIPSHPSIKIIKETIESLNYIGYNGNEKINVYLAHDYKDNKDYEEYLNNLQNYCNSYNQKNNKFNLIIIKRKTWGHLTGNIRNALQHVNSKYILVIQHDFPFIKQFDIQKVIDDMEENTNIKYIRFNKRKNIKRGFDGDPGSSGQHLFGLQQKQKNYTYTRTPGWSDNNHICLTSYYNDIVMKECPDGTPMEHNLHGKINDEITHRKYGTYLFGELNHSKMINHTDGKNSKK